MLFNLIGYSDITITSKTYYISNEGNDLNVGTSPLYPLKTLQKLNSLKLNNGDSILFKCGNVFHGQLIISNDNLYISSFGTGKKPIINGATLIKSKWKLENKVWSTKISEIVNEFIFLIEQDVIQPISRHPNKEDNNGYLNFEIHNSKDVISDSELKKNWGASDLVIRTQRFRMAKVKIKSQVGNVINFHNSEKIISLKDNFGYFFINSISAIDKVGEWAYNDLTHKLYFKSKNNPNFQSISYNKIDSLVIFKNVKNVKIKNISLHNAGKNSISISNCKNIYIDNIEIRNSGGDGITIESSKRCTVKNSFITQINWSGIFSSKTCDSISIENNKLTDIGNETFPKSKTFIGIDCNSSNSKVLHNIISNTGYSGIISAGINNLISYNTINRSCMILDDNGAIYLNNNINKTYGTVVSNNKINTVIGDLAGAPAKFSLANGIYLDNYTEGVKVIDNEILNVNGSGIYLNKCGVDIKILSNTIKHSKVAQIFINNPSTQNPIFFVENNSLILNKNSKQKAIRINLDKTKDWNLGTFSNNKIFNYSKDKVEHEIKNLNLKSNRNSYF